MTIITAAMLSLGAWAVNDLRLNVAESVAFGDWGFNNSAAPTINVSNWSDGGGWQFATALSQDKYCGVDFTFEATAETHVTFMICYEGGAEQDIDVPTGSTAIKTDFAYTGGITKIGFKYGDWESTANEDGASITITSAVVMANSTGEVVELPFANLNEPVEDSEGYTKDADGQSITINNYTWASYWTLDPAFVSDDYEKIVVTFAEPITVDGLTINAEVEGDESWCGTAICSIAKGATKATVYFSALSGVNITKVGFFLDWQAESATLKIAKVELVKKVIAYAINIDEDMKNGSVYADLITAVKGDIVTLKPIPASGYQLSSIVIEAMADTDKANTRKTDLAVGYFITATGQGNGTWTFEMPDRPVIVSAKFTYYNDASTAIEPVGVAPQGDGTWYDLSGRRVTSLQHSAEGRLFPQGLKKGIYIKNGKKFLVK